MAAIVTGIYRKSSLARLMLDNRLNNPNDRLWPNTTQPPYPLYFVGDEGFGIGHLALQLSNFTIALHGGMHLGILANKWRILHHPIHMSPANATTVVKACCVLHNFVRERDGFKADNMTTQGPGLQPIHSSSRRAVGSAQTVHDDMAQYFLSVGGSVSWQRERMWYVWIVAVCTKSSFLRSINITFAN